MKGPWAVGAISIVVLLVNCSLTVNGAGNLQLREDPTSSEPPSSITTAPSTNARSTIRPSSESSSPIPSSASATAAPSNSDTNSQTTDAAESHSQTSGSSAANAATSTLSGIVIGPSATPISNSSYNGTIIHSVSIDGLPITPLVTPAIAVAGALLLVTGVFYTLIGVKTQRVHIFFSTAYLFGLGVTVLVEYVMHPPISNGIQAAYFVAACVTGLVFGAVAMIFADVTEGLGCFLGGFCLSMWFLVLKSGGLVTSTAGKAIFIACFTVGTFALYISHYTRAYGIIGSTSFAGATVVILGIDCFSRAGLKEFWLYIWNLNDALFPLNYEGPYPITRGIRVETAGIIFLFVLGVMSQMKVWKIIKKRREERAAEETRKNEEKERAEEALGRQLEADNEQERALWDAVYGNKKRGRGSHLDSGIGTDAPSSTRKSSMSVVDFQNLRDEGIEMQDLGDARSEKGAGKITVHVAQDDELAVPSPAPRSPTLTTDHPMEHSMDDGKSTKSAKIPDQPPPNQNMKKAANIDKKLTLKATPKPKFVPLPFNVPQAEKDDDASSAATFAASDHFPDRASKRLSGSLLMRKLSGRSQRRQSRLSQGMSQEALVIPHDDDGASSIAATMDGISNKSRSEAGSSRNPTPEPLASPDILVTAPQTPLASTEPVQAFDPIQKAVETTVPPRGVRLDAEKGTVDRSAREKRDQKSEKGSSETVADEHQTEESISKSKDKLKAAEAPKASQGPKEPASLAENLPQGASRIELAYRTNEWAKHLDRAETPETEEIKIHECQSAIAAQSKEVAAPVNVRGLQQTALTAEPAPETSIFVNDAPAAKNNNPYRPHQPRSNSQMSFVKNLERAPSQTSLVSSSSSQEDSPRSSLNKTRTVQSSASLSRGFRSTSTPLVTSPLATSPIQEDVEATFPPKFTPSASHLMSQRDNLIRSKPSSTSLLRSASANSMNRLSAYNTPNASNMPLNHLAEEDDDNISLAQRKSMLQQNPSRTSLINRTLSSGAVTPVKASHLSLDQQVDNNPYRQTAHLITNNNPPHAARLPKSPTDPAALSSWRASLAQLPFTAETQQTAEIERRRSQLLAEKQAERRSQAVEAGQREQRQSVLGREMRRGSMLDAHREAMRRMQGQVNEKLKQ